MESYDTELPFLDIRIYKERNRLETDIYHKATGTFQYLNYTSCHPGHIKQNIPFSMARRICTIVLNPQIKETRLQELSNRLLKRNYPLHIIQDGIERAKLKPLEDLMKTKDKQEGDNKLIFVQTCNSNIPDIFKIMDKGKHMLNGLEKYEANCEPQVDQRTKASLKFKTNSN